MICEICSKLTIKTPEGHRGAMSPSQLTFTCAKSAIETLEKGMKYVQS